MDENISDKIADIMAMVEKNGKSPVLWGYRREYFTDAINKGYLLVGDEYDYPRQIINPNYVSYHWGYCRY